MLSNQNARPQPRQIAARLIRIARIERELLVAETRENLSAIVKGIAAVAAAAVLLPLAMAVLAGWVALLLIDQGFSATLAVGIVAGGLSLIIAVLGFAGWRILKSSSILPHRTISSLKEIAGNFGGFNV